MALDLSDDFPSWFIPLSCHWFEIALTTPKPKNRCSFGSYFYKGLSTKSKLMVDLHF